ncbi:hypothetical protein TTHERM_00481300 (macronuclear) [Tetrahymena thermophila SB210]|uniref:Uncharacterized protein n=1 Tax=Tetrahymena thermophila (strain SB210) TaxID=312017 RepID=I7MEM4_TETTS|nr:hypothetical protein TTHERM_00481300 [Tetrahymena thermophila SB210]EAR97196.1 hypothetical protein TTHERM_00481300 [Tetrahymena thermophila SB210]|eukprot:XP_001017441.1 hypothetical protein TTHERM_00481300 [Tetrahymena thermophila SB210]
MSSNENQSEQEKAQVLQGTKPVYQYPAYTSQYVQQQPLIQSQLVTQPVQYVQQPVQYVQQTVQGVHQSALSQSQAVASGLVATQIQREVVKGESRIEYIPYEKSVIEYEAVQRVDYVPKEKKITDYYAVEYQTEYLPQVYQDRYIEYIPTERIQERVEYQAIQKQIVHQPVQQQQQVLQTVVQPATTYLQSSQVTVPVVQQQFVPTASVVHTTIPATQVVQGATHVVQGASTVVQNVPTAQFVQTVPTAFSTQTLGVPVVRAGLTTSGVRTLGPVPYSVVEEAIKKSQKKDE